MLRTQRVPPVVGAEVHFSITVFSKSRGNLGLPQFFWASSKCVWAHASRGGLSYNTKFSWHSKQYPELITNICGPKDQVLHLDLDIKSTISDWNLFWTTVHQRTYTAKAWAALKKVQQLQHTSKLYWEWSFYTARQYPRLQEAAFTQSATCKQRSPAPIPIKGLLWWSIWFHLYQVHQ